MLVGLKVRMMFHVCLSAKYTSPRKSHVLALVLYWTSRIRRKITIHGILITLLPEFGIKLLGIKLLSLAGARIVEYGSKLLSLGYFIHFT